MLYVHTHTHTYKEGEKEEESKCGKMQIIGNSRYRFYTCSLFIILFLQLFCGFEIFLELWRVGKEP